MEGAEELLPSGQRARRPVRHGPTVVALVMAATLVAVVLAIRSGTDTGNGSGAPAAPATTAAIDRAHCHASTAWRAALSGHILDGDHPGELLLGVSPAGDIIAALDRDVRLLRPDGSVRSLYRAPGLGEFGRVDFDGPRMMLVLFASVVYAPATRSAGLTTTPLAVPNDEVIDRLVIIVPRTGQAYVADDQTTYTIRSGRQVKEGAALLHGHLYEMIRDDVRSTGGMISDYDFRQRNTSTTWYGAVGPVMMTIGGVEWSVDQRPPAEVPIRLPDALTSAGVDLGTVRTDGTAYAWPDGGGIDWATAQTAQAVHRAQSVVGTPIVEAVAGPLVVFRDYDDPSPDYLLDTRSGAVTATAISQNAVLRSGAGLLVTGTSPPSSTTPQPVTLYDLRGLPPLHC